MNAKKPTSSIIQGQAGPDAVVRPLLVGIGEILWDILPDGRQMGGAPANFAYHARALGAAFSAAASISSIPAIPLRPRTRSERETTSRRPWSRGC